MARDFEATVDHIIVQAVRQVDSNIDETSTEIETSTTAIITSSDVKTLQVTPISAVTSKQLKQDVDSSSLSVANATTELAGIISTANDAKLKASPSIATNTEEMITSS